MLLALVFISFGTGLFKGNLQVMVGNLYDDPKYADKRDSAFSIFYMAINIGALFAPTAAVKIKEWAESVGFASNDAYHFSFAVACASLILSIAIYYIFRPTFRHVEGGVVKAGEAVQTEQELSPSETNNRIIALCLVFAVVIFFWMAFHQNGLTLTYFADEFTAKSSSGIESMAFDVFNLVAIIFIVYALFSLFQSKKGRTKTISALVIVLSCVYLYYRYTTLEGDVAVSAPIFQHFNPFFVVALTPVSLAVFGALAKRGSEPSAPRKIGIGMFIAALGFTVMALSSMGLPTPNPDGAIVVANDLLVSPSVLINTYLVLTFAELFLSPMGISFVSKVAPPKYKGLMMGLWFGATAVGNYLVSIIGMLWGHMPLWALWSILIVLCLISALFIFMMMKRLENATK